jgi:hypothetical protein
LWWRGYIKTYRKVRALAFRTGVQHQQLYVLHRFVAGVV